MTLALDIFGVLWPPIAVMLGALLMAWLAKWTAQRSKQGTSSLLYQLFIGLIAAFVIVSIIVLLPLTDDTQGQVLSLLGVILTAVIALSATTFVANMIAGVMLQASQPFRPGDYVRVNDQFGRVTRRSLVHTQIQTEWRDLTTLPNLMLVNNPVTVLHRDGTIIFVEISIGYDVTYLRVEELLLMAGKECKLNEPFVLVQDLLDHAVVYRICGFLPEMKNLLSARSNLRKRILEQMHGHGVEIVSPSFMNQRPIDPTDKVIPSAPVMHDIDKPVEVSSAPEEMIFDKAEEAASLEDLRQQQSETRQQLKDLKAELKTASADTQAALERKIEQLERREQWYAERVEKQSEPQ